jgi:hypothetical protein
MIFFTACGRKSIHVKFGNGAKGFLPLRGKEGLTTAAKVRKSRFWRNCSACILRSHPPGAADEGEFLRQTRRHPHPLPHSNNTFNFRTKILICQFDSGLRFAEKGGQAGYNPLKILRRVGV